MKRTAATILAAVALLVALSGAVQAAPVSISVTGAPTESKWGFDQEQRYTLTFTLNDSFDRFNGSLGVGHVGWMDQSVPVIADITGTGLGGSYSTPTTNELTSQMAVSRREVLVDMVSQVLVDNIQIVAWHDNDGHSMGLLAPDGVTGFGSVSLDAYLFSTPFVFEGYSDNRFTPPPSNFASFFSPAAGTHDDVTGAICIYHEADGGEVSSVSFNINTVTISAVPEPATMSLLALGGIATLIRRRRKA